MIFPASVVVLPALVLLTGITVGSNAGGEVTRMIRKKTLAVVVYFLLLLAAAFYLQKNPLPSTASVTPSPTTQARLLPGIIAQDITSLELVQNEDDTLNVSQEGQVIWNVTVGAETRAATAPGKIEQARDELASAMVITALPDGYSLEAVGLAQPQGMINLTTSAGQKFAIKVGIATPTNSGTYVQVNDLAPVVVNSTVIDTAFNLLVEASAPPITTETPAAAVP